MEKISFFLWIAAAFFFIFPQVSVAVVDIQESGTQISPRDTTILIDDTGELELEDVFEVEFNTSDLDSFVFSNQKNRVVWVRLILNNLSSDEQIFLQAKFNAIGKIRAYLPKTHSERKTSLSDYESYEAGRDIVMSKWPVFSNYPTFSFSIPTSSDNRIIRDVVIYLAVESSIPIINFPLYVYTTQSYFQSQLDSLIALALYTGIILSITIYNFFLWLTLREKTFLVYAAMLFAGHGCAIIGIQGYIQQFLLQDSVWLNHNLVALGNIFFSYFCLQFVSHFCNFKEKAPNFQLGVKILSIICLALFLLTVIDLNPSGSPILLTMVASVLGILSCIYLAVMKRSRTAIFYLIAWVPLVLCLAIYFYSVHSSDHGFSIYWLYSGAAIEAMILSLGIGNRFHAIKIARIREFEEKVHAHRQLLKMTFPHTVTKINEGQNIEHTMPIGRQSSVPVISFDIVGSTKISHPDYFRVSEELLSKCYLTMMEGYQENPLKANAYRIRDTGDGFLCSIGFPFAPPQDQVPEVLAVELSIRFCQIFAKKMATLNYSSPIRCAIGIASGDILGFFPRDGIIQYDLRGNAIVLATRYEAMRNKVYDRYPQHSDKSIIFVQENVFSALPKTMQRLFHKWDATLVGCEVRDDPEAKAAYFMTLEAAGALSESRSSA
ncbi:MAG: hypothetical protein HRU19_02065 [Pseudobacteriovorax sp.]|nr:hypothetical protein [Pseudobacteriovorax sp.]